MKVSYQRDLYCSRMRCEMEGDEQRYGYPLQMCLRNSIPGLLPCSAEPVDGRTYICWDITSRNSLKELSGGGFTLELLVRVLQAVYAVMQELEGYLISSGHLVLLPEQIYLDASRKKVEFICDYEDVTSFQTGMQKLAEYILAGIDHKDQEQMRLGYGLYRLAVQENFSVEEFQRLLFEHKKRGSQMPYSGQDSGPGAVYGGDPVREGGMCPDIHEEDTAVRDKERQKLLDSFFADDEEEEIRGRWGALPLYALLVAMAVFGLEMFFYFRNGRHIHPVWLLIGLLLIMVCTGAACVLQYMKNRGKGAAGEMQEIKPARIDKTVDTCRGGQSGTEFGQPACLHVADGCEAVSGKEWGETMVLQNPRSYSAEEASAVLEPVGQRNGRFIIPAKGAVLGKLPEAADVILPSPAVSRIHARIIRQGEEYMVQDLNSRNGTRVNGRPLASQEVVQLNEEDEICFADLTYRFLIEKQK